MSGQGECAVRACKLWAALQAVCTVPSLRVPPALPAMLSLHVGCADKAPVSSQPCPAVHFEDQLSSEKKCGHLGGKVLVPTQQAVRNIIAGRCHGCRGLGSGTAGGLGIQSAARSMHAVLQAWGLPSASPPSCPQTASSRAVLHLPTLSLCSPPGGRCGRHPHRADCPH